MGYIIVIARVARDLWQRKPTLSSGYALGLGRFTAINPRTRAISITYLVAVVVNKGSDDDMDATPSASLSDRVNGGDTLSDTEDPLICICK